jgi:hypothetical protein
MDLNRDEYLERGMLASDLGVQTEHDGHEDAISPPILTSSLATISLETISYISSYYC